MSEQKQGSDDREKNARDGANPAGDYLPPPALPPGFRSSFFDLKDRTAAISALGKVLSDCAAVERSLGVLEDVWLKHEEKKECLVKKAREVSNLQDEIEALRQQHESRRQEFEERETHAKSQRLEIANDLKECSESIIGLAKVMRIELHTRIIKAPSRRQISRDDALEKYIDKWLPELEDHLDALWSEMRMRVYGHQAQLLSGRIIPLEHARRLGLEGWLNRIEALSYRVNYYFDVSSALCSRQDTITKHRNGQRKIREEILSKEVQCATLEDELIQFRAESKTALHVQQGAVRKIKAQLGTLCDELLVVLGKFKGREALLACESRECELLVGSVRANVAKVSSPEIGKFLGLATGVLKEIRAITAWIDLGENLGVFETCLNPKISRPTAPVKRDPDARVFDVVAGTSESPLTSRKDHPDFAKKVREQSAVARGWFKGGSPHVRSMIQPDFERVIAIDESSFPKPWNKDDFMQRLRQRSVVGLAAIVGNEVAGFFVYQLNKPDMIILRMAVAPEYRRKGIGYALLARLFEKGPERESLKVEVDLDDLGRQLFLRSCGFRAVERLDSHEGDVGSGQWLFQANLAEIRAIRGKEPP